jgi:ATP-dependent Lon protease
MIDKLRYTFDEMVVYKDLKKSSFFKTLNLPSFMRDWLLTKFADETGNFNLEELKEFVNTYLPKRDEWKTIKDKVSKDREKVKLLAKVSIDIDLKTNEVYFALPDYGLSYKETIIEDNTWQSIKHDLLSGIETWGMIELGYRPPVYGASGNVSIPGKLKLLEFKNFCPYQIDLEYYKNARKQFTITEWIDVLLGAIDYNSDGYLGNENSKLTMLTRLLPFIEKRLNLIELAPKGTGKSYIFGNVSRHGWLASGGIMSRAKLFFDMSKRTVGLVAGNDFVTLDEIQTISFTDAPEMKGALKTYLEYGNCTIGNVEIKADAGFILCGNIKKETMDDDGFSNMFEELPTIFHESALIDRIHGFIKGWNIPRLTDGLKVSGWALNSEYFCSILHELRDDISYRAIVDELIEVNKEDDERDTEAIKRISTAYLKLFFPHIQSVNDVEEKEFNRYCLNRAKDMRAIIKFQLGLLDPAEFGGKDIPNLQTKKRINNE